MGTTSSRTGQFWICPQCRRHAPMRIETCQCGFARPGTEAATVSIGTPPEDARPAMRLVIPLLAVGAVVLTGIWLYRTSQEDAIDNVALKQRMEQRQRRAGQPQVVVVPVDAPQPSADPSMPAVSPERAEIERQLRELAIEATPEPERQPETEATTQEAAPASSPSPLYAEFAPSDIDERRRMGAEEFDRDMRALSARADQADIAWERFVAGCHVDRTSITSVTASGAFAGVSSREWIGFAGAYAVSSSTVEITRWTEACAEAGTFFALFDHVRQGLCLAEDRARRASVYPGVRREIRERHRLEWSGWDRVCTTRRY